MMIDKEERRDIEELVHGLISELASYSRQRLDKKDVCEVDVLAHATKNLIKIANSSDSDEQLYSRSYSRNNNYRNNYRNNNMRGYSHNQNELVEELRHLMEDAPDEASRQDFQRLIMKLESM